VQSAFGCNTLKLVEGVKKGYIFLHFSSFSLVFNRKEKKNVENG
jgi:hypothetical protein